MCLNDVFKIFHVPIFERACCLRGSELCNSTLLRGEFVRFFISSTWMVANVWTVASRRAYDEAASARAILNIQRRQIESTLSSYSTEALRAPLKAPTPRCTRVANRPIPFSYERIENICHHEDQQNPCPQSSVAPHVSRFRADFFSFS